MTLVTWVYLSSYPSRSNRLTVDSTERYFFTFGSGARGCLGKSKLSILFAVLIKGLKENKDLSWMEMSKVRVFGDCVFPVN